MNYHQDRILVTGVSDGICSELVKQLSDSGAIFRPGVHSNDKHGTLNRACNIVDKLFYLFQGAPKPWSMLLGS